MDNCWQQNLRGLDQTNIKKMGKVAQKTTPNEDYNEEEEDDEDKLEEGGSN